MMERIVDLPAGIFGIRAGGIVGRDEYNRVMNAFDATIHDRYGMAALVHYRDDTDLGAIDEDARFLTRLGARGRVRRLAFIGPERFMADFEMFSELTGTEVCRFDGGQWDAALEWLKGGANQRIERG